MVTTQNELKILEWDEKPQTNNKNSVCHKIIKNIVQLFYKLIRQYNAQYILLSHA